MTPRPLSQARTLFRGLSLRLRVGDRLLVMGKSGLLGSDFGVVGLLLLSVGLRAGVFCLVSAPGKIGWPALKRC